MVNIQNKGDCSGCHACMAACPKMAITMKTDTEGFLYPEIDRDICVDCGICDDMCQAKKPIQSVRSPHAYACWNTDENIRMISSSGGIFQILAKWIIQKGGVVFGAGFDKDIEYRVFHREDFYMQAFLNNLSLRPSCYECHSKTKSRNSDITLADFWGIENILPEMFDNKGTSLVLANSEKGQALFEEIKEDLMWWEVDFEEAILHNTLAFCSVQKPDKREDFFSHLSKMRFDRLVKRETLPPLTERIYWKIRRVISQGLRKCGVRK